MNKPKKKITATVLILMISLVAIFCCCLTGSAQAGVQQYNNDSQSGNEGHCCPDMAKESGPKNNHECKCEKTAEILAIREFDLSKIIKLSLDLSDGSIAFFGEVSIAREVFVQHYNLQAFNQIIKSAPPIYLQDSVFRL